MFVALFSLPLRTENLELQTSLPPWQPHPAVPKRSVLKTRNPWVIISHLQHVWPSSATPSTRIFHESVQVTWFSAQNFFLLRCRRNESLWKLNITILVSGEDSQGLPMMVFLPASTWQQRRLQKITNSRIYLWMMHESFIHPLWSCQLVSWQTSPTSVSHSNMLFIWTHGLLQFRIWAQPP